MGKAPKLKVLQDMTVREIKNLPSGSLREAYQNLRKSLASRVNTFRKHDSIKGVPEDLRYGLPSSKGKSDAELVQLMKDPLKWMRKDKSKYSRYAASQDDFREKMQDAMPDMDLSTAEKMDRFGRFMGDMQSRYGEMWHAISNQVRDVYRDLTRLNKDPEQFMRNYDYWVEEVEEINRQKAERHEGGRRRSTKLSTYARKMKRGRSR